MGSAVVVLLASLLWRVDMVTPPAGREVRELMQLCERPGSASREVCRCLDQALFVERSDGLGPSIKQYTVDQMLGYCVELKRR